ncbi:MAG TPA: choice-of-anchor B family protein [Thermoanaerobaculia bacterium]|nr:choice-of-anchor B family protein [Thermoanaerobaculia bacterium]
MSRCRPESHGFLLFLSFCLVGIVFLAGPAGAMPPVELHDDHGEGTAPPTGAPPGAQAATSCVNGFAGAYPCKNVDLLSFLPLDQMGAANERGSDIWGWTDPQSGREYALMVVSDGASFVDVSDPTQPRWLGFLPTRTTASSNRDVRVYRDHAYIAADSVGAHGMQVFDLKRLRNVSSPQTFTADHVYTEVQTVHNIDINVDTGFAYLVGSNTCSGGLHMVDLRDPLRPRFAGCYSRAGNGAVAYIHDVQCVVYRGIDQRFAGRELCFASNVNALTILDVTDKSAVREIARKPYQGNSYCHQGWLTEDHSYFLMDDEGDERSGGHNTRTYLWDVRDLTDPRNFANHDHATAAIDHDQYVHQGHVYQGNYRAGLRILSVANVAQGTLEEVGYFDVVPADDAPAFSGAWGAYPFFRSGIILVPGMEQGLYVLRRSDLAQPTGPCKAGTQTLCLAGKRFKVEVDWSNQFDGSSGKGRAIKGTGDTAGFFSFGDLSNLELMVKILDDGSHYQLYYGQLTNLGFSIRVTDTETGRVTSHGNGPNNCGGIAEIGASDGHGHDQARAWLGADPTRITRPGAGISERASLVPIFEAARAKGACAKGTDGLCLLSNRFKARVTWRNQFNGAAGSGKPKPLSGVTGSFAFTDLSNVELLVKVLDAGGGRILVLWGAMSNLEYNLEVTDTKTGEVKTYKNPAGTYCGGLDEF